MGKEEETKRGKMGKYSADEFYLSVMDHLGEYDGGYLMKTINSCRIAP
jgi:hypothetical protein